MPKGLPPTNGHDAYAVLRVGDYRRFLAFRLFTTIAFQMQGLIVGWQVYELTKDPLALGLIGLAEAIPNIITALYAGHVADRYNRKAIILTFTTLFLTGTFLLFLFSVRPQLFLSRPGVLPVYIVVMISGISRAFLYPSIIALMATLVPRELYANASTWSSTVWHVAAITGPAAGGLIYGFFGVKVAYLSVLITLLIAMTLILFVKGRPSPPLPEGETLLQRLSSGFRFVFKNQVLVGGMSLDMLAMLFGGATAMLPVFAAEVLMIGPKGLGFLRAAPMVGAVTMSLVLAHRPPTVRAGRYLFVGVTGFALSIICFALSRNYYLSLALLLMSGMFDNVSVIVRNTAMQLITPDGMRGRVAAVNAIFVGSSNEVGSFESGVAARLMGLVPSVVFGGAMTLVAVGIMARVAPKLRRLNLGEIG